MLIFFLQGGTIDQPSLSTNEQQKLPALAQLFSQYPITPHNQRINEEASRLVLANPSLLFRLGELLKQACELVHSSWYNYKKGKTRFKLVDVSDAEAPLTPKRPKMDAEMRQQRMQVLEEDIEALNNQMNYKRKRLQIAEINKRYDQCEVISKEIQEVKVQKRALESELAAFRRKEKKPQCYRQKKRIRRNETRHGIKAGTQLCHSSSGFNTSDESDFSLSSPSSTSVYSHASRSASLEIVDDNSCLQATEEQVVIESESALQPFEQVEIGEGSSQGFHSGLAAFQN